MKLEVDLTCPGCSKTLNVKVESMRPGKQTKCRYCGAQIKFSGDDGRKIQKSLDDLAKAFR